MSEGELRERVLHTMGCCTVPEHVGQYKYPNIFDENIADKIVHLITAQNDATYAKVMEEIEHAETITDLRQSIAKIFGKADANPEERQG